jgi:hypothetical protein
MRSQLFVSAEMSAFIEKVKVEVGQEARFGFTGPHAQFRLMRSDQSILRRTGFCLSEAPNEKLTRHDIMSNPRRPCSRFQDEGLNGRGSNPPRIWSTPSPFWTAMQRSCTTGQDLVKLSDHDHGRSNLNGREMGGRIAKEPLFVLDVPRLKTGFTVADVAERIFQRPRSNFTLCCGRSTNRSAATKASKRPLRAASSGPMGRPTLRPLLRQSHGI